MTTVMAVKTTPKAMTLLKRAQDEKGDKLTVLESIEIAGMTYAPAAAVGIATIGCICGIHILDKRNQASLASAYALLAESHRKYRRAANTIFGEDADTRIKSEIARDVYLSNSTLIGYSSVYDAGNNSKFEEVLFYDCHSKRYFSSTIPAVINAQYHANRNFALRGWVPVNEFYEFLGIDGVEDGYSIGWGDQLLEDGCPWIDFDNRYTSTDDGLECFIISTSYDPKFEDQ
jgi:hypothetical protein